MITLHQFAPAFGLPNASAFCMKVETYLRLAGLEYETVAVMNPAKGPKGKAPWITDGDQTVGDSELILQYLKQRHGDPLNEGLSADEKASHLLLARMLESHLYFIALAERWLEPGNAELTRDAFFGSVPRALRGLLFSRVQKGQRKMLEQQGLGRHSREERIEMGKRNIDAMALALGDRPYFGGDAPREIDATSFAFVANLLIPPFRSPLTDHCRTKDNLAGYSDRMMREIFPEYATT